VDVVHDFGFEESLGSVIHDFITKLGLGNVLPKLLNTSSTTFGRTIFVDDFVAIPFGSFAIRKSSKKFFDDLKLSSKKGDLWPYP
jgi:hypothetical protein